MDFIRNFPFFSIMIAMFTGVICSVLKGRAARALCMAASGVNTFLSACTLAYTISTGTSFVYWMGHFPAPWGNEIRAGSVEALTATVFCAVIFMIILGGSKYAEEIENSKLHYLYLLSGLLMGALLALVYTNDMFTAYVFIEINTIAACGFIMIRHTGKSVASAVRYMVMSLLGSGLVLIGICLLYTVTGHLLMQDIHTSITQLVADGQYTVPLIVIIGLITVGLAIKSGLYPFHMWIPDAYAHSLPTASAMLSGLASKGYIFLLIKIYYRVIGLDSIISSDVLSIVFIFGIIAMIMGSVHALNEGDIRRMSAYSSVSHIGYIFMCIGMGTNIGMCAALLHMYMHSITKSWIFLSTAAIAEVSGIRVSAGENGPNVVPGAEVTSIKLSESLPYTEPEGSVRAAEEEVKETYVRNLSEVIHYPDLHVVKPGSHSNRFDDVRGAGRRNRIAGLSFMFGAFSMVGVPLFAGFSSKLYIGIAATNTLNKIWPVMLTLAVSTILMVGYFLRMVIQIYLPADAANLPTKTFRQQKRFSVSMLLFAIANIFIGLCSGYLIEVLERGMNLFG